jgi:hypothetical protein
MGNKDLDTTSDVFYRIKRGLAGYVSYLAACEMNAAFSEYILYEPMLRIFSAQRFEVQSEVPCPGFVRKGSGDVKRLDFVARGNGVHFAVEVKWARGHRLSIKGDVEKLLKYREAHADAHGFLCVFGPKSSLVQLPLPEGFRERGSAVYAEFGKTKFGCRIYQQT